MTHPKAPAPGPRQTPLADEAIRRGVQYLAFRAHPHGLAASYAPGPGPVSGAVALAAYAALEAHKDLAPELEDGMSSPARDRATAARARFTGQLAEVKAGITRAPTTALRAAYLDALADYMVEVAGRRGIAALAAWAAPHAPDGVSEATPGARFAPWRGPVT